MKTPKWFLVSNPKPAAEYRLFCFPYAGGSATSFLGWEPLLPDRIELVAIQLPGRANRLAERLLTSVEEMVEQLISVIPPLLDKPYIIYGHSLGSAVAFELLHALKEKNLPPPVRFFGAARRAPQDPPRLAPIHDYPLDSFKRELRNLNGTPDFVLDNPDLMEIFVPILRTDLKAAYTYYRAPDVQVDCDVSIFGGAQDDKVLPGDLGGWQAHFSRQVDCRIFDGGHFFMDENGVEVLEAICDSAIPRGQSRPASATATNDDRGREAVTAGEPADLRRVVLVGETR